MLFLEQREESGAYSCYPEPTNETRAETMFVLALPCKEEEGGTQP